MEYVVKEEARKVAERELKKARQLRQAQVRQQTVIWTEETRRKFEIEKEKQIQLLANALTAQAQANAIARIEQINIEHDLAMAQVGAAHRAAAKLGEEQKIKELKRLKNVEIAKERGSSALQRHRYKTEKQKESHLSLVQRKQQVRQAEDLKSKNLVDRKPFTVSNRTTLKPTEKQYRPPEYQQSKAKILGLAPSYQGQENSNIKSPQKARTGKISSHDIGFNKHKKSVEQHTSEKLLLRPSFGVFAKEVERRQSGVGNPTKPERNIKKPLDKKIKNVREQLPLRKLSKQVKPVSYQDVSVPNSFVKYMPPPGLTEKEEKVSWDSAWVTAEELKKESIQSLQREENMNQQREMLAKYRGGKALELERLSRELKQLTAELTGGMEIPKNSLESAQLGLDDPEEQELISEELNDLPTKLPKSAEKALDRSSDESKRISPLHRSSLESKNDSRSSSNSITEYYTSSSKDDSGNNIPEEIEILKPDVFKVTPEDLVDRSEKNGHSLLIPTKMSKNFPFGGTSFEESKKGSDRTAHSDELESLHESKLSSSSITEFYTSSDSSSPLDSRMINSSNQNLLLKKSDNMAHDQSNEFFSKLALSNAMDNKPDKLPKTESPLKHASNKRLSDIIQNIVNQSGPIRQAKLSSGSTTEYYSPPYTSTPDGSKSRINESSIFKPPLGVKEGKALRRYVTKMLHMRRESVERLPLSGKSSSENSKIVADSFQSDWSSFQSSAHGSPHSVSSSSRNEISSSTHSSPLVSFKINTSSPKSGESQLLSSVAEEEFGDSHNTAGHSSSGSTVADISMKFQPLSSSFRKSHDGVSSVQYDTLASHTTTVTSIADILDTLNETQIRNISPYHLLSSSNDTSSAVEKNSSVSSGKPKYPSGSIRSSKIRHSKDSFKQSVSSEDDGPLPDLSPILRRLKSVSTEQSSSSKNLFQTTKHTNSSFTRPDSGGSSDKEVLRGTMENSAESNMKIWKSPQSPVYNVTDHADLLASAFVELRKEWASISIERPPWCT